MAVVVLLAIIVSQCTGSSDQPTLNPASGPRSGADGEGTADAAEGSDGGGTGSNGGDAVPGDGGSAVETSAAIAGLRSEDTTTGADGLVQGFGVSDDDIRIGFIVDPTDARSQAILIGQLAFWDAVNARGGVAGRSVVPVMLDTDDTEAGHIAALSLVVGGDATPVGDDVLALGAVSGVEATAAIAGDLAAAQLAAVPLTSWSGWADPDVGSHVFEVQASDCVQAMNSVTYGSERYGTSIAIYAEAGQPYDDAVAGARLAIDALELTLVLDGTPDASGQVPAPAAFVDDLMTVDADFIWLATDQGAATEVIARATEAGFRGDFSGMPSTYVPGTPTSLFTGGLADVIDEKFVFAAPQTMWGDNQQLGMQEMMAAVAAYSPDAPLDPAYIAGWMQANVLLSALERAADSGALTRSAVVASAEAINVDQQALGENQQWSDSPNETIIRGTFMYEIDLSEFDPTATVSDPEASSGFRLRKGPYRSGPALAWEWETCSPLA